MYFLFFLFFSSNSWAVSNQDINIENKVRALNSYKAYLVFEKEKKKFENRQKQFLKKRKKQLQEEEKRTSAQNRAYILDFLNNIQSKELKDKRKSFLSKKISAQEKGFLAYQKKQEDIEKERVKSFFAYKKKYKKYQERKKKILDLRLKAVSSLRDRKKNNKIPVF